MSSIDFSSTIRHAGGELARPLSAFASGSFGRLFRDLKAHPWLPDRSQPLEEIARRADRLHDAPGSENPAIPAGYTYFGQFLTHDITLNTMSNLDLPTRAKAVRNLRTPCFDLDSVYGCGPELDPFLYEQANPAKLLVGRNALGEPDLPRNADASLDGYRPPHYARRRTALVGDARNDETLLIAQLHLAFLCFHNLLVDDGWSFEKARRLTRWHYQWVVLYDFLPRLCGSDRILRMLHGGAPRLRYYDVEGRAYIPVEFAFGAFRMGHSMVRESYHLNDPLRQRRRDLPLSILPERLLALPSAAHHLGGSRLLPEGWSVQWDRFVDHEKSVPQPSMRIEESVAEPLRALQLDENGAPNARERSVAYRTLVRGWRLGLPSGQRVACLMGEEVLDGNDPLWLYVLREASEVCEGTMLGPVGARIVAEVVIGLLHHDGDSVLHHDEFTPLATGPDGSFQLRDFLALSGAPMNRAAVRVP